MDNYEQQQYQKIAEWKNQAPSVVSRTVGKLLNPITWVVNKVIPPKTIEGVLVACNGIAEIITDCNDIIRDAQVSKISDLQTKDLHLSDQLANEVHNWAIGVAAAEGLAAGATGVYGLIADVPALITMSFRVVHKIGLCYGFECKTEADKQFVMGVLSAAGANSLSEKAASVAVLQRMNTMIAKNTWKKLAEKAAINPRGIEAVIIGIKSVAKRLGINITKRKALQAIPIIGAGVGAAINTAFLNDVAWAARRNFQERWLMTNNKV